MHSTVRHKCIFRPGGWAAPWAPLAVGAMPPSHYLSKPGGGGAGGGGSHTRTGPSPPPPPGEPPSNGAVPFPLEHLLASPSPPMRRGPDNPLPAPPPQHWSQAGAAGDSPAASSPSAAVPSGASGPLLRWRFAGGADPEAEEQPDAERRERVCGGETRSGESSRSCAGPSAGAACRRDQEDGGRDLNSMENMCEMTSGRENQKVPFPPHGNPHTHPKCHPSQSPEAMRMWYSSSSPPPHLYTWETACVFLWLPLHRERV